MCWGWIQKEKKNLSGELKNSMKTCLSMSEERMDCGFWKAENLHHIFIVFTFIWRRQQRWNLSSSQPLKLTLTAHRTHHHQHLKILTLHSDRFSFFRFVWWHDDGEGKKIEMLWKRDKSKDESKKIKFKLVLEGKKCTQSCKRNEKHEIFCYRHMMMMTMSNNSFFSIIFTAHGAFNNHWATTSDASTFSRCSQKWI